MSPWVLGTLIRSRGNVYRIFYGKGMCWVAWGMFRMNASRKQTNHTGTQQGKAGGHNTNRGNTVEREM